MAIKNQSNQYLIPEFPPREVILSNFFFEGAFSEGRGAKKVVVVIFLTLEQYPFLFIEIMITHCGQKFVCHNVFRFLLMSNWKQPLLHNRVMSTQITAHKPTATRTVYDYNKILISHAQTFKKGLQGQLDAVAVLEEMKRNGVPPNSQSYLQLIIRLAWKRHRSYKQNERLEGWFHDFIAQLKAEQNKRPIPKVKKVFQSLSFRGHPHMKKMFLKCYQLFDDLGIECWNAAIIGCFNAKEFEDAEELFNLARDKKIANVDTYSLLIESYLQLGDQKAASRIFSQMFHDRITASYSIYEKFIEYYISLPPNIEVFKTLERLWQAVLMTTSPNNNIPDKIIKNLLVYFGENRRLPAAEQIILDIKLRQQRLNRDCLGEVFKIIMQFTDKRQTLSALSLYYDLIGGGYKPDSKVTYKLMKTVVAMNDTEAGQQMLDIIKELSPNTRLSPSCYDLLSDNNKTK